jgi:50S ribosomal protein L16 3-hydroxylase
MSNCLAQLFQVPTAEAFLGPHWPGTPCVVHGPLARFAELSALPELAGVEQIAAVFHEPVMVILADERDESSAIKTDAPTALAHYQDGLALCFESVDRFIPTVDRWLQSIRQELGLPAATWSRSLIYAGKSGAGNFPHYDANANFVVQLQGTKRWTIAKNTHVVNPVDRWAMTSPYLPVELQGTDNEVPRQMPAGATTVELTAGSVLFVPRGYWHATEIGSPETLAINFTYSQPSWAEVLGAVVLQRLHRQPEFRALADGLGSLFPAREQAAHEQLALSLEKFQREVATLDVKTVIAELRT